MRRTALAAFACTLALAPAAAAGDGAGLVPLSPAKLALCERSGLLRPACPRLVPRVQGAYLSHLAVEQAGAEPLDVFDLQRGGEDPRKPGSTRPPSMAHVVAVAGRIERLAPFAVPRGTRAERVRDGAMTRERRAAVPFGRVRWAGRSGALYVAPPYPHGGMLGNHLVFSWRESGRELALSLHAWEPLAASVATLRAMVESLPPPAEARRLARLSPVRRLDLPAGAATRRVRFAAPSPARHAFDVYVVARARSDVGIRIETRSGELRILGSTRDRDCTTRPPFRICLLHFPRLEAIRGGIWTLVVAKRSTAPARVRVDVTFR